MESNGMGASAPGPATVELPDMSARKKDKVCIVGFADSKVATPFDDDSYEFWGVNEMWKDPAIKRCDVLFELHDYKWILEGKRLKEHIVWLRNNVNVPVFMQEHFPDIPMSVPYPKRAILDRFGSYFTNTISWEIALAIQLGFKEIRVYGVNMANDVEYSSQRPSCEYFIGLARGMGITVYLPPESDLLKCMYLYGFEDGELSMMSAKFDAFIGEQDAGQNAAQGQFNQAVAQINQRLGAKGAAEYFKKAFIYPNNNFSAEKLKEK
jgi:hypothetical protein